MAGTSSTGREEQFVVFRLGEETYGLDIGAVQEIIVWQPVTRVPRTPEFMEGIINLRGHVIPVIDLRRRFGLPAEARGRTTRIVVVEIGEMTVGFVVDAVSEVIRIPEDAIEPPSDIIAGVSSEFIRGIARLDQQLIILLNPERILERTEQETLVEVQQEIISADTEGDGSVPEGAS